MSDPYRSIDVTAVDGTGLTDTAAHGSDEFQSLAAYPGVEWRNVHHPRHGRSGPMCRRSRHSCPRRSPGAIRLSPLPSRRRLPTRCRRRQPVPARSVPSAAEAVSRQLVLPPFCSSVSLGILVVASPIVRGVSAARERMEGMPGETALGSRDPAAGGYGDPKEYEGEEESHGRE